MPDVDGRLGGGNIFVSDFFITAAKFLSALPPVADSMD